MADCAISYISMDVAAQCQYVTSIVQAIEQKQLAKDAAQRLNQMIDELRNSQNADLSAKNLGEEGCCYISEGLAFNDRWLPIPSRA